MFAIPALSPLSRNRIWLSRRNASARALSSCISARNPAPCSAWAFTAGPHAHSPPRAPPRKKTPPPPLSQHSSNPTPHTPHPHPPPSHPSLPPPPPHLPSC